MHRSIFVNRFEIERIAGSGGMGMVYRTVASMVEQSAENARFLEELIRAAAARQLDRKPDTAIAMLQARIGHLEADARRWLARSSDIRFGKAA